jgi:uncharacterized protein (TIGR03435 family)
MNNTVGPFVTGLANHVWQSTAFAVAAWLLTILLRRNPARVRYGIWLAASIKFLIPFSLLVAVGDLLPQPKASIAPAVYTAMQVAEQPFTGIAWTPAPSLVHEATIWSRVTANIPTALVVLWLAGATTVFVLWALHWRRLSINLNNATPITVGRELEILRRLEDRLSSYLRLSLPLRLSTEQVEPSIHGMLRPVLVWPEQLSGRLDDEHIEAIMTHELVHARRVDNLTAALHMLVEAVFWFHPLVWWMERRLIEERERACDEAVVELGGNPDVYAESLLKTCRFCVESALPCAAGVTGAELKKRIVGIMTARTLIAMTWPKKILVLAAAVCAMATPVFLGQVLPAPSKPSIGQSATQPSGPNDSAAEQSDAEFEVVSIKQNRNPGGMIMLGVFGERFLATEMTLQQLIGVGFEIEKDQLAGEPDWVKSEFYDVEAKVDHSVAEHVHQLSFDQRLIQYHRMLQTVLADRFKLTFHCETKELPVYALIVVKEKKGSQISEAKPDDTYPNGITGYGQGHGDVMRVGRDFLQGQGVSIAWLVHELSQKQLGRHLIDKTGLTAKYDFTLQWTPDTNQGTGLKPFDDRQSAAGNTLPAENSEPSLFTAIQEQLGLKLQPEKDSVPLLVIDHIERPSAN